MGEVTWREQDVVGWLDNDQTGALKLVSVIRFAWAGYRQFSVHHGGLPRAEYFARIGCAPVVSYIDVATSGVVAPLDAEVTLEVRARVGFLPGDSPRYGGITDLVVIDGDGAELGRLRNHWFWFNSRTAAVQREPVWSRVDQDEELELPPPRPRLGGAAAEAHPFRWALRDTDLNRHANTAAYLERAENALADAGRDGDPRSRVSVWFRRPSVLGEAMCALVGEDDRGTLVDITSADADVRSTLRFSP